MFITELANDAFMVFFLSLQKNEGLAFHLNQSYGDRRKGKKESQRKLEKHFKMSSTKFVLFIYLILFLFL